MAQVAMALPNAHPKEPARSAHNHLIVAAYTANTFCMIILAMTTTIFSFSRRHQWNDGENSTATKFPVPHMTYSPDITSHDHHQNSTCKSKRAMKSTSAICPLSVSHLHKNKTTKAQEQKSTRANSA
jgi:hypothetical protein